MRSLLALSMAAIAVGFAVAPGNCVEAGNAAQGEHAFVKCAVCHAKGKTNGIGPGLSGVIGRHAGSVPGFHYSEAMKNSTVVWDKETLDAFIMAPQKALPGNIMPFPGIPGEEEHDEPRSSSSRKRSIVCEEMMFAIRQAQERVERLEQAIRAAVPDWSLAQGGHRIDGLARHRSDLGDGVAGRARRSLALSNRTRADGISRHGVFREFNRRYDQARSHHQGRQSASATHARGVRLELSASAPYRHRQTGESRGSAAKGARDRLEGAVASQPPLPSAHQERQTQDGRHHRSRA